MKPSRWQPEKSGPGKILRKIGPYRLGSTISEFQGLTEFSFLEYLALPKVLVNERVFNAPPIDFLGRQWEVVIGASGDCIYRMGATAVLGDPKKANQTLSQAYGYCELEMGKPTEEQPIRVAEPIEQTGTRIIWDKIDGSVILSRRTGLGQALVQLFLISAPVFENPSEVDWEGVSKA